MASIAGGIVSGWVGSLDEWAHRDISIERSAPGMPGNVAVVGNYSQSPAEITTIVERRTLREVRSWADFGAGVEGRTITVEDPHGIQYQGVFVVRAATRYVRTLAGTYYAITTWTLVLRSQAAG